MSGQDLMIDTQIGYEVLAATLTHSPKAARRRLRNTKEQARGARRAQRKRADEKLEENGQSVGRIDRMGAGGGAEEILKRGK